MTPYEAVDNAARLLRNAEMTTDLALMQRLEALADSWVSIGRLLAENVDAQTPGG